MDNDDDKEDGDEDDNNDHDDNDHASSDDDNGKSLKRGKWKRLNFDCSQNHTGQNLVHEDE